MANKTAGMFLCLFFIGIQAAAQEAAPAPNAVPDAADAPQPRSPMRDRLFFGGYINLSLGSYSVIGIEPMAGYRISPKTSAGMKIRYDYIRDARYSQTRTTSNYGGSLFARRRITPKLYAQLEPAAYNYELFYSDGSSEREWVPYVFAGGGYVQPLGQRSWVYAEILFDLLQDSKSPYDDWTPFFSIGAGTGF